VVSVAAVQTVVRLLDPVTKDDRLYGYAARNRDVDVI